jgi:hypothetical protein
VHGAIIELNQGRTVMGVPRGPSQGDVVYLG